MPEDLGRGGEYEEDIGDGAEFKDDMPPGSQALHDLHDAYAAVKEAAEHHQSKVEHPGVLKEISGAIADADKSMAHAKDAHMKHYPDHPAPGEGGEGEAAEDMHPLEDVDEEPEEEELEEKHTISEPNLRTTNSRTGARGGAAREKFETGDGTDNRGTMGIEKGMRSSKRGVKSSLRRKSWKDERAEALRRTNERMQAKLIELLAGL